MVHPVGAAGDLRSIQRLSAMDEAQVVSPIRIETTEINARERVTLLAGMQKGKEDSLLLVERDGLRRGIFVVVLRGDEPVESAVLHGLAHLFIGCDHVLRYFKVVRRP